MSGDREKPSFWPSEPKSRLPDVDKVLEMNRLVLEKEKISLEREKLKRGIHEEPLGAARELYGRQLSTVTARAIDWLWTGWIPKGYITIWAGETGAGKSTVLADVTARVTTGAAWPGEDSQRPPGRVLWLGSEDGVEELTVPRMLACDANLEKIIEIQGVMQQGQRNTFSLQDDLNSVCSWLDKAQAEGDPFLMLVIDPVTSYLPGRRLRKVDLNDAGQLRSVLEPWLEVAQKYHLAIVCVTHFMKDTTRSMLHRVLGSAAFTQTCRSLCAVVDRPGDGQYEKTLIQVKVNLPDHPGGAWKFVTEKAEVARDPRNGKPIHATRPVWEELDAGLTPEGLMGGKRGPVSSYPVIFGPWLKAHFMTTVPGEFLSANAVRDAAIAEKAVTARWWNDHSNEYLDKRNINGVWMCRPK